MPTRFLINQCQIITFCILKSGNIESSRTELEGIVLQVPSNQIKVTFIIILPFNLVHLWFFSSPELAQGELLGYRDVRCTCGRPRRSFVNFLACVHSRRHSFDPKFMKLCQKVYHHNIKLGHVGSKTRSLGQILEKPCVHSRGHSFDHKFMKVCQNVNHHNV